MIEISYQILMVTKMTSLCSTLEVKAKVSTNLLAPESNQASN